MTSRKRGCHCSNKSEQHHEGNQVTLQNGQALRWSPSFRQSHHCHGNLKVTPNAPTSMKQGLINSPPSLNNLMTLVGFDSNQCFGYRPNWGKKHLATEQKHGCLPLNMTLQKKQQKHVYVHLCILYCSKNFFDTCTVRIYLCNSCNSMHKNCVGNANLNTLRFSPLPREIHHFSPGSNNKLPWIYENKNRADSYSLWSIISVFV